MRHAVLPRLVVVIQVFENRVLIIDFEDGRTRAA